MRSLLLCVSSMYYVALIWGRRGKAMTSYLSPAALSCSAEAKTAEAKVASIAAVELESKPIPAGDVVSPPVETIIHAKPGSVRKATPGVCGASFSGFNYYPAVLHRGDDIKVLSHVSVEECVDACRDEASCVGVVFAESLQLSCWLKSALGSGVPSEVADTYAVCTAASPPPPMDPTLGECPSCIPRDFRVQAFVASIRLQPKCMAG